MHKFANFRDVAAGLPTGLLNPGVLLRSDAPLTGYPKPSGAMKWPPATVIDLRHPSETSEPHPLKMSASVHTVSLLDPARPGSGGPDTGDMLKLFYHRLLEEYGAANLVRAVGITAASPGPVLVHCLAGKDRTGVAVALLLRLTGIERELVAAEYLLTNLNQVALAQRVEAHNIASGVQSPTDPPLQPSAVLAPATAIAEVLDFWDAYPGGVTAWYLDHCGTESNIAKLIQLLRTSP